MKGTEPSQVSSTSPEPEVSGAKATSNVLELLVPLFILFNIHHVIIICVRQTYFPSIAYKGAIQVVKHAIGPIHHRH